MKVRMLPVNNVFSRFHRVVRDLAKDSGKEITLEIFGEETEIDKKVMDRIGEPLVHLVRNAVDHGIEGRERAPGRRQGRRGPDPPGRLPGRGPHLHRGLRRRPGPGPGGGAGQGGGEGAGRPEEADRLPDEQVLGLIFLPGFSTAREVTEISGRGVGMDVVKRAVEDMGGSVRVRSAAGRGTTVTISLPADHGHHPRRAGGGRRLDPGHPPVLGEGGPEGRRRASCARVGGRRVIRLREEVLSLVAAAARPWAWTAPASRAEAAACPWSIVDYEDKKIGLGVDRVLGNREIVIKTLSRHYREIEGLIGASILGDGRIALIVDVEALIRKHHHVEGGKHSAGVAISLGGAPARPKETAAVPRRPRLANPPPLPRRQPLRRPGRPIHRPGDLGPAGPGRSIAARSHGAGPQRRSHPGLPGPVPVERQGGPGQLSGVAGGRAERGAPPAWAGREASRLRDLRRDHRRACRRRPDGAARAQPAPFHELLHRLPAGLLRRDRRRWTSRPSASWATSWLPPSSTPSPTKPGWR